ncbi:MAG: phosphodiester glycosidase family protein [Verrucomicrobia bacterium]|nr:phosphodiester glycosidase family protein [Verrucomicrobiota bacterium]
MSESNKAKRRTWGGCLVRLLLLGVLTGLIIFLVVDHFCNLRSNIISFAFRKSTQPMEVKISGNKWKRLADITQSEMEHALASQGEGDGVMWRSLYVRRQADNIYQRIAQLLFESKVNVIEFTSGRFDFLTSFREHFDVTTADERATTDDLAFAITANFRDPKGKPLGLVVHEGKQCNASFPAWTGYFFVKDGKPWFGPKTLFQETPGILTEATQGYPSLMKNHTVFSYVDLAPDKYFDGEKITYRALAGTRQNGTVVFIVSGNGGIMNVTEVAALAQKLNVQHATLLDGGRALQYTLRTSSGRLDFAAFNTTLNLPWKFLERQRSPVFIGARLSHSETPEITR